MSLRLLELSFSVIVRKSAPPSTTASFVSNPTEEISNTTDPVAGIVREKLPLSLEVVAMDFF